MTPRMTRAPRATRTPLTRTACATALTALTIGSAAAAMPASSTAATFGVIQCGDVYGDGGPARNGIYPFRDGSTGFQSVATYGQGGRVVGCDNTALQAPQGLGMRASLEGTYSQAAAAMAAWRWISAPDTKVLRYAARFYGRGRAYDTSQGRYNYGDVFVNHESQVDPDYDYRTGGSGDGTWKGPLTVDKDLTSAGGVGHVTFGVSCGAANMTLNCHADPASPIADMNVQGFQAVISDQANPQVSNVSGDLVDRRYWTRTVGVTASVTDKGGGVANTIIQRRDTNGTWVDESTQLVDANGGSCVPLSDVKVFTEKRVYTSSKPCRNDASGEVSVDTSTLPEGERDYRVMVEDAAGNRAALVGPQARVIDRTAPAISFADTPNQCVAGTRAAVQGSATDAVAGVQSLQTLVTDAKGNRLPVATDGTIECPAEGAGPLAVTTTAIDKAGNEASLTRPTTVKVTAPPAAQPTQPTDGAVGGGKTDTSDVAPTPIQTPAPGAGAPTAPPRTTATTELLACEKKGVVLTEAYPSGRKDVLRGVAGAQYVGHTVTLLYGPKHQVVGRQPVGVDGTFTATVKAPTGKASRGNNARYQAIVGTERSAPLKRVRRMYATQVYRTANGGSVYVAGRLTKPFKATTTVTIKSRSKGCGSSAWRTVKTTKVDSRGNFGTTFPVPSGEAAVVVRAQARVKKSAKSSRSTRTQTMPAAVQMR